MSDQYSEEYGGKKKTCFPFPKSSVPRNWSMLLTMLLYRSSVSIFLMLYRWFR